MWASPPWDPPAGAAAGVIASATAGAGGRGLPGKLIFPVTFHSSTGAGIPTKVYENVEKESRLRYHPRTAIVNMVLTRNMRSQYASIRWARYGRGGGRHDSRARPAPDPPTPQETPGG